MTGAKQEAASVTELGEDDHGFVLPHRHLLPPSDTARGGLHFATLYSEHLLLCPSDGIAQSETPPLMFSVLTHSDTLSICIQTLSVFLPWLTFVCCDPMSRLSDTAASVMTQTGIVSYLTLLRPVSALSSGAKGSYGVCI